MGNKGSTQKNVYCDDDVHQDGRESANQNGENNRDINSHKDNQKSKSKPSKKQNEQFYSF